MHVPLHNFLIFKPCDYCNRHVQNNVLRMRTWFGFIDYIKTFSVTIIYEKIRNNSRRCHNRGKLLKYINKRYIWPYQRKGQIFFYQRCMGAPWMTQLISKLDIFGHLKNTLIFYTIKCKTYSSGPLFRTPPKCGRRRRFFYFKFVERFIIRIFKNGLDHLT